MNFQFDFFRVLAERNCWWVNRALENPKAKNQLDQFDGIVYMIESSSCHNKEILSKKCQQIISHIISGRTGWVVSHLLLDDFCYCSSELKQILEFAFAEETCRASLLSEIKVFSELVKLGVQEIQFLEEESQRKTPDFKGVVDDRDVFIEVKYINPSKEEEQRMMVSDQEFVEQKPGWRDKVRKKIFDHLTKAQTQFESVDAYKAVCKRWVYVSIVLSSDSYPDQSSEFLIPNELIHEWEKEFNFEVKLFNTWE